MAPGKIGKKRNSGEQVQSTNVRDVQPFFISQQNGPIELPHQVQSTNDIMESPQQANQDPPIENSGIIQFKFLLHHCIPLKSCCFYIWISNSRIRTINNSTMKFSSKLSSSSSGACPFLAIVIL